MVGDIMCSQLVFLGVLLVLLLLYGRLRAKTIDVLLRHGIGTSPQ